MDSENIFELILDKRPYFAGESVTGRVVLNFDEEKLVDEIEIYFVGKANLSFYHGLEYSKHSGQKTYINKCLTLVENLTIPSGVREFPFSYKLPSNLPSTIKLNSKGHGEIFYYAEAVLKMSQTELPLDAVTSKCFFNVLSRVDLNSNLSLAYPRTVYKTLYLYSNKIYCNLNISKTGFVPGELLLFNIVIGNQGTGKLKHVIFQLKQRSSYISIGASSFKANNKKNAKSVVCSFAGPSIEPETRIALIVDSLRIPANITPTQNDNSHLILVKYELQIIVKMFTSKLSNTVASPSDEAMAASVN